MFRLASFTARELKNCKQGNKRGVSVCPGSLRGGEKRREPCVAQRPPGSRAAVTVTVTVPPAWKKEGHRRGQRCSLLLRTRPLGAEACGALAAALPGAPRGPLGALCPGTLQRAKQCRLFLARPGLAYSVSCFRRGALG